ncbi:MAG TPA: TonB-dependent receptor [Candidatus Acidoferrales bacterium]|nr:TonB-dependent receptor [Candidatus Acidoferrales bacterium]
MAHSGARLTTRLFARAFHRLLPIVFILTLAATAARAQVEAINGSIRGRVADQNGAVVPGVAVTVTNEATGYTRAVDSGADGYYVLPSLPLGSYTVTMRKEGFSTLSYTGVVLQAGVEAVVDGSLKVSSVATTVEVQASGTILQPSAAYVGRTISDREVANLPLTSRNPYNFIMFQPGVSGHPNQELGIPRTLNTNGQMDRINYQMDGMYDTESDRFGLRLFPISDAYVREVQTVANSFAPEFGNTTGDIYNVITGSGTNDFHGMFEWLRRPISTAARPMLLSPTQPKPDLELTDYAVNAGGNIIKNKLFYYGAYEHMRRGGPTPITITSANAAAIGLPASDLVTPPSVEHSTFVDSRVDWTINSKNQAFLRFNYFRNEYPFNTAVGGLNSLDAASDFHDRAYIIGTQIVSSFTPTLLNEFRFSWPYRKEKHVPNPLDGPGPAITISGVANFNGTTAAGDSFDEKVPGFNDNVTYIHGAHTFKQGVYLDHILDNQVNDTFSQFTFPSIAAYLAAKSGANPFSYSNLKTVLGNTGVGYHSLFWGAFWQDSWQATPKLMLIYGLRYDKYDPPAAEPNAPFAFTRSFNSPGADFAPRIGLAYEINAKTVVRASFGKFYDQPPTNTWYNALFNDGSGRSIVATVTPKQAFAPPFPQTLTSLPTLPTLDVTAVSPNFKDPYALTASLQVSRELSRNDSVTIGYASTQGHQLLFLHNINLINPISTLADGRPVFSSAINGSTRFDPRFNNISLQDSGANSNYHALLLNYQHRWSQGLEMSASYTWSHTISDAPDVNSFEQNLSIEDSTNRERDRGNSSINRPDAFTLSTVYAPRVTIDNSFLKRVLNDNMFAFLVVAQSGDQQNITSKTAPLNGDSTTSSVTRPIAIGRNTVRGPKIIQFDTRYTRDLFRIRERITPQFLFEANNLFNRHSNIPSLNTAVPVNAGGFATIPASFPFQSAVTLEARIIQFGLGVRW